MTGTVGGRNIDRFELIADTTSSMATFIDVARGKTWTVPILAWHARSGRAVVLDPGTARLELVEVMDEARGRAACIWSASTIIDGAPMSVSRAEAMLRGHGDKGGPPKLRIVR